MLARPQPLAGRTRRRFLGDFGKGSLAIAVMTPAVVAACSSDTVDSGSATTAPSSSTTTEPTSTTTTTAAEETTDAPAAVDAEAGALRWARADLGFVSAFVLARGNKAAIVDTGVPGSADAIGRSLADLGLTYNDVDHVVLTHHHGDHAGSIAEVMERSVNATVYAGESDLDDITFDTITGLVGGEDVFGLEALATPGHTAGHMAVIDHTVGLLVAGDAIFTDG
ncbi:MAG: MBL fold metallo-hydrolase, partial [Acidimicrobiales bacterium]|nr:MBL fold metallo-hydrolase [Acidimicrobiales bacterium]